MSFVNSYILSIIGVSVLLILIEMILPDGEMNKYIKGIGAFFLIATIVSPILKVNFKDINFNNIYKTNFEEKIDYEFLYNLHNLTAEQCENNLVIELENKGFKNVKIKIDFDRKSKEFIVLQALLDISKMKMNSNGLHFDKYREMTNVVSKSLNIDKNKVVIYE